MKKQFLTKEEWKEAAERITLIAEPIAEYLSKLNADGMGEQDKREFLCDMQLAYMAMMHVSEFAADKCGFILVP